MALFNFWFIISGWFGRFGEGTVKREHCADQTPQTSSQTFKSSHLLLHDELRDFPSSARS
ncbi:hypothetical protein J6590_076618, partial [Homalodisca vitripennis]